MKRRLISLIIYLIPVCSFSQTDYTTLVNPFIGTGGHGHTYPGATMPFGMMQLSPDTRLEGWDGCSGYHYSDNKIYGFSHTHLSGTGIADYCDILFMPFTGNVQWENKDYASSFSHTNEKASPGYYEVLLDKHNIKAQLSTSFRSGMHQYTFPGGTTKGSILIDLKHRDEVLESYMEKVSDTEVKGFRRSKSWAKDQVIFFYIKFEKPIKEFAYRSEDELNLKNKNIATGKDIRAFFSFDLTGDKTVKAKIGISGVSIEGAKLNLDTEIPHWDFNQVRNDAYTAWYNELRRIEVRGGTKEQQAIFYTALYHTMLSPNIYCDVDGQYRGTDLQIHRANGFTNYSVFSLWDTYRAFNPLMTIINPRRTSDWINTFLAQYKNGGQLPVWELSGNETYCMIGCHSIPVIADAYQKGIRGFDTRLALEAMQSYTNSDHFGMGFYTENGFLSNEKEHESVSKTVEYAYDDWCIAQFARMTGYEDQYNFFIQRAQNYKNLFDPGTSFIRGKVQSMWYTPFDPKEVNNFYTEGNSWQYSFAAPQDIEGLITLMGGRAKFATKLNQLFTTSSQLTGRQQGDVTGLIGQYAHGNEPSHHMAYLFAYAGMPWRTEELVHKICREFYKNTPDGLIGNEDCGQMSAWFVLSTIGFYPVCPGDGNYILGTPMFDEVKINLENGKNFLITAERNKPGDFYVQTVLLNDDVINRTYIKHTDITAGGRINFSLSPVANKKRGTAVKDMPSSFIPDNRIVPVPYIDMPSNKFTGSAMVKLKAVEPGTKIWYRIIRPNIRSVFVEYKQPFPIDQNTEVQAYAVRDTVKSKIISQEFYKKPDNRTINVLSKVHPMYTAGGPGALVDGVTGNTNWRAGEWQSYFDTDFEAVVDLKTVKSLSYAGVHVLQDVSPWIVFPKELIVSTSVDGLHFTEAGRIQNKIGNDDKTVQVQELGVPFTGKARYVKLKAISGGKLPAWHESAGNPSHLFIDEVLVR